MDYTTLISGQHADKPNFMALVDALCNGVADITACAQGLSADFDLDSAMGAQLDVVGLWVGVSRIVPNVLTIQYFGFSDNVNALGFGELGDPSAGGPFYELGESFSASTVLPDSQYRQLLYAQILTNQTDGSPADFVTAAQFITNAPAELTDPGNLTITLHVGAPVNQLAAAMLGQLNVLPKPAGVILAPIDYTNIALRGAAAVAAAAAGTHI